MRGYGSENLIHIPGDVGRDLFSFYCSVVGSLDFNFVMWYILKKWILHFFNSVVHINRHISCLFSRKGETGKPKFQNFKTAITC